MVKKVSEKGYYTAPRLDLIRHIPENAKCILEVGCGDGTMGRTVRETIGKDIKLIGIEYIKDEAEKAKAYFDQVISDDVEKVELPYDKDYFDCMIYGDVLEHLVDPWVVLNKHCLHLKKGGCVIASIPNVAHYRIQKMLKKGQWTYQNSGLMDRTHLRFFTRKSIIELFDQAGLEVAKIGRILGASKMRKFINRLFGGIWSDTLTEQYIIVGQKL